MIAEQQSTSSRILKVLLLTHRSLQCTLNGFATDTKANVDTCVEKDFGTCSLCGACVNYRHDRVPAHAAACLQSFPRFRSYEPAINMKRFGSGRSARSDARILLADHADLVGFTFRVSP